MESLCITQRNGLCIFNKGFDPWNGQRKNAEESG